MVSSAHTKHRKCFVLPGGEILQVCGVFRQLCHSEKYKQDFPLLSVYCLQAAFVFPRAHTLYPCISDDASTTTTCW